jgi:ankyrin repeat protein
MKRSLFYFFAFFWCWQLPVHGMTEDSTLRQLIFSLSQRSFNKDQFEQSFTSVKNKINTQSQGTTLLHEAVIRNNHEAVRFLLLQPNIDINVRDSKNQTPLHIAASNSNLFDIAGRLVRRGANVNAQDMFGSTPLHRAAQWNNPRLVVYLLEQTPVTINIQDNNGNTPLHVAAARGDTKSLKLLLQYGANIHIKNKKGKTALDEAKENQSLATSALLEQAIALSPFDILSQEIPDIDRLKELITTGADLSQANRYGFTALHLAARQNNTEAIQLLINNGADVNAQTLGGFTALHIAVAFNNEPALVALLKAGANPNAQTVTGQTPLHLAVALGNANSITHLIYAGADQNIKNKQNRTPLILAQRIGDATIIKILQAPSMSPVGGGVGFKKPTYTKAQDLVAAIKNNSLTRTDLNLFITATGFTINTPIDGQTLLHYAILSNNPSMVINVLRAGANPNTQNSAGQTPLFVATARNNIHIIRLLLAEGANPCIANLAGLVPLDVAKTIKNPLVIALLEGASKERVKPAPIIAPAIPVQESDVETIEIGWPPRKLEPIDVPDIFKKPAKEEMAEKPEWKKPLNWIAGTPLGGAALAYFGYLVYPGQQVPTNLDPDTLYAQLIQALRDKKYDYAYQLAHHNLISTKQLPEKATLTALIYYDQMNLVDEAAQNAVSLDPRKRFSRNLLADQLQNLTNLLYLIEHANSKSPNP